MSIKCGHFLINENCKICQKTKKTWYKKLHKKGFSDIEEEKYQLLRKWTGNNFNYNRSIQSSHENLLSSWPEIKFKKEEEFLNRNDFSQICENLFNHGNSAIKPKIAIKIWEYHCDGLSLRKIKAEICIPHTTIFDCIKKLKAFMMLTEPIQESEIVTLRNYDPNVDLPFLYASWKNSVWYDQNPDTEKKPNPMFSRLMTKKINLILEQSKIKVTMAVLKFNSDQIIGYSVMYDKSLNFIYVKLDYRKQGIGTILSKGFYDVFEPSTKIGKAIVKKKALRIKGEENGIGSSKNETGTKKED